MCTFHRPRGQGWVAEFLETPVWPSWNYLACLLGSRGGRVAVVLFRGTSIILILAKGTVS